MITIAEDPIRTAFANVKRDIAALRNVHETSMVALSTQLQTKDKLMVDRIDRLTVDVRDRLDSSKKDIWQAVDAFEGRMTEMQKLLAMHEKNILELRKTGGQTDKKFARMATRLEDFEALSVDVEDVEKHFATKGEVDARIHKSFESIAHDLKKVSEDLSRFEESQATLADKGELKKLEEQYLELKSELVLRSALEEVHDRIDAIEKKTIHRGDGMQKQLDRIEDEVTDVYELRKSFVGKEHLANVNKEIKLLTEGLKAAQKGKARAVKEKPAKARSVPKAKGHGPIRKAVNSVKRFFIEEDEKPTK